MPSKALPPSHTLEEVNHQLRYDPETGLHWWLIRRHKRRIDLPAGSINAHRSGKLERVIVIDGRRYYANVLAWWMMTGEWPDRQVDHIDTDSTNNRWSNLRLATHPENNRNKDFSKRQGASRLIGASFHKGSGLWRATLRKKCLGYFKTAEAAHEVYKKAALEAYGEFAHSSLSEGGSSSDPVDDDPG